MKKKFKVIDTSTGQKINCRAFIPTDVGHFNPMVRGYKHLNSYIE